MLSLQRRRERRRDSDGNIMIDNSRNTGKGPESVHCSGENESDKSSLNRGDIQQLSQWGTISQKKRASPRERW